MSVATVVTQGFGSFGSAALVVTQGFASAMVAGTGDVVLFPPIPIPDKWLLLDRGFDIEGDRAFQELARRSEIEGLIREAIQNGETEIDLDELDGLEPDEELFGKRGRRRRWRG